MFKGNKTGDKLGGTARYKVLTISAFILLVCGWAGGEELQAASNPSDEPARPLGEISGSQGSQANESTGELVIRSYGQEASGASFFVFDDFEGSEVDNRLGGRANIYVQFPSRVMISRTTGPRPAESAAYYLPSFIRGTGTVSSTTVPHFDLKEVKETSPEVNSATLILKYEKANEGGPFGEGGWCGFYTLLKQMRHGEEDIYFDARSFSNITMWVRGETGHESFMLGLSDRHWDKVGDSLKSEKIESYLESGMMTTNWQKARIPLNVFFLDHSKLSAVTISFEGACFPDGSGTGTLYIDNMALEK
jgi:hypothetical protein